jgi:starvation-inducible DNA-binding protein
MYPTLNDLPEAARTGLNALLNTQLADAVDMATMAKQAHWNVKGPHFIGLHKMFDELWDALNDYVDLIAERVSQLGGVADGTARDAAGASSLDEYPHDIASGHDHVVAVAGRLASLGASMRAAIAASDDFGDADTADIFTEVSRGVDKWLWFVEAHLHADT